MKNMIFKTLMCVFALSFYTQANAQELSPFAPLKAKNAAYTKIEIYPMLNNPSSPINKNWTDLIVENAQTQGWYYEFAPPEDYFGADKIEYLKFFVQRSTIVKRVFKEGEAASYGTKKDGSIGSTTRASLDNEYYLQLDPNDLETEGFIMTRDYEPFIYASITCLNGWSVYAPPPVKNFSAPRLANKNNQGWVAPATAQVTPPAPAVIYITQPAPEVVEKEVVYIKEQPSDYVNGPYYPEQRPRVTFSVGVLFGNACCGFGGHSFGYCGHNQPYQQFGYQPAGGGAPQVTNVNVYNQIVNTNTNTATSGGPSTPNPVIGNPVLPPNGNPVTGGAPILPSNRNGISQIGGSRSMHYTQNNRMPSFGQQMPNSIGVNSGYPSYGTGGTIRSGRF